MLYAQRDENGHIVALFRTSSPEASEPVSATDPEVLRFIEAAGSEEQVKSYLAHSDAELIRVMEDLIYLLVDKNVILFTELPEQAQRKLASRRHARGRLQQNGTFSLDEDELL